jgi:hypothetical protein
MTTQVINRKIEVCKKCGAKNSFRKRTGLMNGVYYAECKACGLKAIIRNFIESIKTL